jgi:hypothetical protein
MQQRGCLNKHLQCKRIAHYRWREAAYSLTQPIHTDYNTYELHMTHRGPRPREWWTGKKVILGLCANLLYKMQENARRSSWMKLFNREVGSSEEAISNHSSSQIRSWDEPTNLLLINKLVSKGDISIFLWSITEVMSPSTNLIDQHLWLHVKRENCSDEVDILRWIAYHMVKW